MFENQNKYQDYLSLALLELLNENTFYDIKPETIIKKSQIKIPDYFFWLADNKIKLLKYYFQSSNNKILSEAVLDFNEDDSATVNDKLTDIIIRSFEFHQKFRLSLANIYKLKFLNFKGYKINELYPRRTRRATAINWLIYWAFESNFNLKDSDNLPQYSSPSSNPAKGHYGDPIIK